MYSEYVVFVVLQRYKRQWSTLSRGW